MYLKQLLSNLDIGVDYISLREVKNKSITMYVRNELVENFHSSEDRGLMIEVLVNGQFAYAATNSFEPSEVKRAALAARENALKASRYNLYSFSQSVRPTLVGEYHSPSIKGVDAFNTQEMSDLLVTLSASMKIHDHIITRTSVLSLVQTESHFVSSNGSDIMQTFARSSFSLGATASSPKGSQHRSYGDDLSAQFGLERLDRDALIKEAKRVASEALELLEAEECPNETMDLILAPDQMFLQIHESIGHPLELDRILGDERNYAGWSFVKPSDFGTLQYGSKLMNVTFDPTVRGQNASCMADDIGSAATREFLIKDGLLVRGIGSLESQARLNLPGVSSQRATSWNRAPIDRMGNINLEPGSSSFKDMIKSVERGVLMRTTRSWSIDDYRNKFQFGCEHGQLIENGELTKLVKNPNYRGITAPFWNKLKMVGDASTFVIGGVNNCGKGEPNQVIYVGHASPTCLFSGVEVFGGGK
jgi:predicted Zn-dependent protease